MSSPLTPQSPLLRRLQAWSQERFPPVNFVTGFVIYAMTLAVGRIPGEGHFIIEKADFFGALALICQFIVLRVLDEHKDYEIDLINYPRRVLQRGLIQLKHLRVLGVAAAGFELLFSLYRDGGLGAVTMAWAAMTVWTCLMAKEFFCGSWLKKHLLLYAISHMLVMPFTIFWTLKLISPGAPVTGNGVILMMLTLISGFAFEVTRKTRGAEEESATLDSYSKILGSRNAAVVISALLVLILIAQFEMLHVLMNRALTLAHGFVLLGFIASLVSVYFYSRKPTIKARKVNEGTTSLFMLINYTSIIVVAFVNHGLRLWK